MSAIGTKRTCRFALHMSAFDPKRTWGLISVENRLRAISHSPTGRKVLGFRYCGWRGPHGGAHATTRFRHPSRQRGSSLAAPGMGTRVATDAPG